MDVVVNSGSEFTVRRNMRSRLPILLVSAVLGSLACKVSWAQEEPQVSRTLTEFHYFTTGPLSPTHFVSTERHDHEASKVETQGVEAPSFKGGYEPVRETETETIQVDANTVRVMQRWFSPSNHQLFQVTEEDRRTEPGGRESVVRTTSAVDLSGHWQIQERDVEETVSPGPDTKETKRTVLGMVGGTLTPVLKSEQTERRKGDSVEVQRRLLTPDGGGRFQVFEERQTVAKPSKDGRTMEEKTYRKGDRGQMMVIEQTVSSEWQNGRKGSGKVAQTYSTYVPGRASDGRLQHMVEQRSISATTARGSDTRSEEHIQQVNPGAPDDGLRTTTVMTEVSKPFGKLRTETHKEVRGLDGSGTLRIVWVSDSNETRETR
jgi:hypothetical protein